MAILGHFCPLGYFWTWYIRTFRARKIDKDFGLYQGFYVSNCSNISQYINIYIFVIVQNIHTLVS